MLHLIYQSPFESTSLKSCITAFSKQDVLLLLENGVLCALQETESGKQLVPLAQEKKVFILKEHAAQHGILQRCIEAIQFINFEGFVDLVAAHEPVLRW